MARKPRRFNLRKVRVNSTFVCGALAAKDVVAGAITAAVADKLRIISAELTYQWVETQAVIDGGLEFGLSHSDYSAAEVEECLEAAGSIDLGDKIAQERANRLVRSLGTINQFTDSTVGADHGTFPNTPIKTRLNWLMSEGDTLNAWVRNGSEVVWSTGSSFVTLGKLWVKD